jgi:copper chaperone CopZ
MQALNRAWEVYGVRKIKFDAQEHTIRVEYDATRLNDGEIAAILRRAGIDLREKVQLV